VRYQSVRPDDAALRKAMMAVATERRRFGYRRVHVMLERQCWQVNQKKLRRLYREEKLQVRKRGGRKRALGTRRPMLVPQRPNERWSLDFVPDAFTDGRRFRVCSVLPRALTTTSGPMSVTSAISSLTKNVSTSSEQQGMELIKRKAL
jgi:putative transposase